MSEDGVWQSYFPNGTHGYQCRHAVSPSGPVLLENGEVTHRQDHLRFFWRMQTTGDRQTIAEGYESTEADARAMADFRAGRPWDPA